MKAIKQITPFLSNTSHPLALDQPPVFGWHYLILVQAQQAYQIQLSETADFELLLWDSGRQESTDHLYVAYMGPALKPFTVYYWRVKAWVVLDTALVEPLPWSEPVSFETVFLVDSCDPPVSAPDLLMTHANPFLEQAWLQPIQEPAMGKLPYLRTCFPLTKTINSARLLITAQGLYHVQLNQQEVSNDRLTPGWTSYHNHLSYQVFDITKQLSQENCLSLILADGWWRGEVGWAPEGGYLNSYGDKLSTQGFIFIDYSDQTTQLIMLSTLKWRSATGGITTSSIYDGEHFDARLEPIGWRSCHFDDKDWQEVPLVAPVLKAPHHLKISAQLAECCRLQPPLDPINIQPAGIGQFIVDFGVNQSAICQLTIKGKEGQGVQMQFAEVLDGTKIYTDNLCGAKQTDHYIVGSSQVEIWRPQFTFHGFRYVLVTFERDIPEHWSLQAYPIYTDLKFDSHFECSDPKLNQLFKNIINGQKSNFIDNPLDCPQRNERLGWTADTQVFAPLAYLNADCRLFYQKWLQDLRADQWADGNVPHVVPDIATMNNQIYMGSAGWSDAVAFIPWSLYQHYGDLTILKENYQAIKKWVEFRRTQADDDLIVRGGFHFGDWLAVQAKDARFPYPVTDKAYLTTMFWRQSMAILYQSAQLLHLTDDAIHYQNLYQQVTDSVINEFVSASGRIGADTQANYLFALAFDLSAQHCLQFVKKLEQTVRDANYHLRTGFLSTPYLLPTLSKYGLHELACQIILQEDNPSWLYAVNKGATSIWERWDSLREDGRFHDPRMNSFNHYAYGIVGLWLYHYLAGIQINEQRDNHLLIQPKPNQYFNSATAYFNSKQGRCAIHWSYHEQSSQCDGEFTVPSLFRAEFKLPKNGCHLHIYKSNHTDFNYAGETLGAGTYRFSFMIKQG